ncbi:unnamed protein product [Orchesella dallaii]|uniref:Glucose-methanol-choline oxidoreductase N-terminal domain-containing protein n=1 Tax=Orchesella dallaii TaxID=48710 RepID=A0ABP1QMR5_9HEXA
MNAATFTRGGFGTAQSALRYGSIIYTIVSLMSPGFHFFTEMDRNMDLMNMPSQNNDDTFDFIIVGGGSAGSSLASRLSERFSVLVLEAGAAPSPIHSVPTYAFAQYNDPAIDWGYRTVPQRQACFGLINNTSIWPGGKVLGGSSLLNAMMYVRGNVQGFDEIADKTGDSRWKLTNILKYYLALENYNGWFDKGMHGSAGPLHVERPIVSKFTDTIMRAGQEMGYAVRDPNGYGPYTEGFAKMDLYLNNGRRSDAYHEFLQPAMQKYTNLVVRKFSHVTRVLFRNNNEAYGVEYLRHGRRYIVKANFETILSAGALRSPHILMLSGIGPKEHLQEHGIRTIMNLPVGQYLQDKYGAYVGPFLLKEGQSMVIERDLTIPTLLQWFSTGKGLIRSSLSEGTWAILTDSAKRSGRTRKPDIHSYILTTTMPEEISQIITRAFNFKPEILRFYSKAAKLDSFFQLVTLNSPVGHGRLTLRDSNPLSYPVIDPKYLENEEDARSLLEGVKFAVELVENTTAMQDINGRLMPGHLPGCESYEFKSDQYYECLIRHVTFTAYKFSGTVPIGKGFSDKDAVVDSHLRVLGTRRLRVVDGSVLQQRHTSINDVTCRMLGQLAADIIFDDWRRN